MKLSAVIPVWNGREYLAKLLDTIASQTLPFDEVIVIDNGSADGAGELAAERGAKVVRFAKNLGFAVAVNRGMAESRGELAAVLNSDVELTPDWARVLVETVSADSVYFATGQILSSGNTGTIDGAWDLVSEAGMPWRAGNGAPAGHPAFSQNRRIKLASFTAILLRRELWDRAGPLDERFESYLEDVDFGMRCSGRGFSGIYAPKAMCFHHGSAALGRWSGESVRLMSRNQVFLVRKHLHPHWWNLLIGQGLWGLLAIRNGAGWAWFRGKVEALRKVHRIEPGKRFESQDNEIFALQAEIGFDRYWKWYRRLRLNDTGTARE